ncbi:hypothetical protein [Porphyromonas macacae]|uniref:hypothetical protein n=1 Tax=Porphyromonas macacae TaxID=28115 RepID=UPI000687D207|nr:hypothetical protein [Porphyromonas macacae]
MEVFSTEEGFSLPQVKLSKLDDWKPGFHDLVVVDELHEDDDAVSEYTPMLSSSQDPFSASAAYTFSPARFRIRGYDSQYTPVYLNGVEMNDMNTGYGVWSLWGG